MSGGVSAHASGWFPFPVFPFPPQPFPWLPLPQQELHDQTPNPEHREMASEKEDDKLEEDEHDAETQKQTAELDDVVNLLKWRNSLCSIQH